jgi:hypothetical protein
MISGSLSPALFDRDVKYIVSEKAKKSGVSISAGPSDSDRI